MKRTQIYLPEIIYQELLKIAHRRRVSLSEIIRERIAIRSLPKVRRDTKELFGELVRAGKKFNWRAQKNLSQEIDKIVYG